MRTSIPRKIGLFLLPLAALAAGAQAAFLFEVKETEPNEVVEVAPGVYFRHGDLAGKAHCNNGFVVFKDFVVVIDANFPSGAEACLQDIRKVTDRPVKLVFDTHHHGDHAYGNPIWVRNGAIPIAQEKVLEEMKRYEPERWLGEVENREDVRALKLETPMPPVITYPDRMVIDDGTQRLELLHFGTAHTRGDGFAYLPKHRVLFTGDAVVNGPYNFMGDGDTHSWVQVIDRLKKLDVEVVGPGHGPLGGRELLDEQQSFIRALQREVAQGRTAGKSLEELQASVKLGEEHAKYVGKRFAEQIEKVFGELEARGS